MKIKKVNALPITCECDAMYLILNGDYCEAWITDKNCVPKMVGNSSMILGLIAESESADPFILNGVTGENISGGSVVVMKEDGKIYKFDIADENNYAKTCGIAKQAGLSGDSIDVYVGGVAHEVGAGWLPGKAYYVSETGLLTVEPPESGILKIIGVGIDNDKVLINNNVEVITI